MIWIGVAIRGKNYYSTFIFNMLPILLAIGLAYITLTINGYIIKPPENSEVTITTEQE